MPQPGKDEPTQASTENGSIQALQPTRGDASLRFEMYISASRFRREWLSFHVMSLSTEQLIRRFGLLTPLCILVVSGCNLGNEQGQPIIDVHLHAYPSIPPAADPIWEAVPDEFRLDPPNDVEEHRVRTLAQLNEHNVVLGVLSGPSLDVLESWKTAAGDSRFLLGAWLSVQSEIQPPVEDLRAMVEDGRYQVLGELNLQYVGLPFDDARLLPYYALAEELGVPVGLHASGGPPGTPYFHASRFRVALGDPSGSNLC